MSDRPAGSGSGFPATQITDSLYRATLDRGEGRTLNLFSRALRDYRVFDGLPSLPPAGAHLRQHPLSGEWISYSGVRQGRTFLPNASDCPLCPMTSPDGLTDVPVDDYEVAIFTNRFAALTPDPGTPPALNLPTRAGIGVCEVISYSAAHQASLSTIGAGRIGLLIDALAIRLAEIMAQPDICWVLPFENRGREIGVTLDHPHGQLYALSHLPAKVAQAAAGFATGDPLAGLADSIPDRLKLAENESGLAFVPPWAKYPFETWVVPHQRVPDIAGLTTSTRSGMAELIDIAARRLDAIFDAPMPYTFGWQLAPRGYEDSFHLHCIFQPMKRAPDRMKYLASVEQFTGFYLVDLPPEDAADLLNGKTTA